ncbi:MAG TPA: methyltransferase domain-containing protein, partial [Bacteroidota bacterium]|nr:methyltransferase domain-containing protein [Bacteroidota bacterium]
MIDIKEGFAVNSAFDEIADEYDLIFEENLITQNIRSIIWDSYLRYFSPGSTVLDINCGTGTDAIFLAEHGISVTAIDSSSRMIEKAKYKINAKRLEDSISIFNRSYDNIEGLQGTFDGCISIFGGVNCTDDLSTLSDNISPFLKPGGTFIACVMNRISITEIMSYIVRLKFKKAFRRF